MADEAVGAAPEPTEDKISLVVRGHGVIVQPLLGMDGPYLLLKPRMAEEDDLDLDYQTEIGGVPQDGPTVRSFGYILAAIGESLKVMTNEQIESATREETAGD